MTKVLCVYLLLICFLNKGNCEKHFLNYGNDEYAHVKLNTPIHFYSNIFDHINVRISVFFFIYFFVNYKSSINSI